MVDILENSYNPDGWLLVEATAINDLGVIVGNRLFHGELRDFKVTHVPEPSSRSLVASAVLALAEYRWRVRGFAHHMTRSGEHGGRAS